ncbi:hypothetical protein D9758_006029 [Tetrapyrgos nigripes]|uniref:P-loop containing nucleoside triphosphate hydrolase protein n=1 Tax=Tetrapyrgos nigripes TaxID=182062 RepID=A0A8H5D808_9AGAR|nr:hypothetical protein D9758_006029 [Tetrapyrgos nigripes]
MSSVLSEGNSQERIVLILVGLIGSGKVVECPMLQPQLTCNTTQSSFATSLERHFPNFVRCNQDELGDRRRVEALARESLSEGLSVCIDRTNFNPSQRRYWIDIAHEFPGSQIWVIVFDTPYEVCAERLRQRTAHPTITSPEQGLSVLARFASDFQAPVAEEGFDRMISFHSSEHPRPEYSHSDVTSILQRLRDSPSISHTRSYRQYGSSSPRSRPWAHSRGRGRGSGRGYYNPRHSEYGHGSHYGEPARSAHLNKTREQTSTFSTRAQTRPWRSTVLGRRSVVTDVGIRNGESAIATPSIIHALTTVSPRSDGGFDAQSID